MPYPRGGATSYAIDGAHFFALSNIGRILSKLSFSRELQEPQRLLYELDDKIAMKTGPAVLGTWQRPLKGWPRKHIRAATIAAPVLSTDGRNVVYLHETSYDDPKHGVRWGLSMVDTAGKDPRRNRTTWVPGPVRALAARDAGAFVRWTVKKHTVWASYKDGRLRVLRRFRQREAWESDIAYEPSRKLLLYQSADLVGFIKLSSFPFKRARRLRTT